MGRKMKNEGVCMQEVERRAGQKAVGRKRAAPTSTLARQGRPLDLHHPLTRRRHLHTSSWPTP